jgi:hypothetical protein
MEQESPKALELVMELGSGGELHLVPSRGEWLDKGRGCRDGTRSRVRTGWRRGAGNSVQTELDDRDLGSIRTNRPVGQLAQKGRDVGSGSQLREELLDLAFGPVNGAREEHVPVFGREVRCQLDDAGQVEPAVREHREEHGVLSSRPGHVDPQIGFGLGEMKDGRTVDEHRGGGFAGVEVSSLHLGDVGDEFGLDAPGLTEEVGEPAEEIVVGEGFERPFE